MKYRQTEQKTLILRTIKLSAVPLDAVAIAKKLRHHHLSQATIYRALKFFSDGGQIAVVEGGSHMPKYVGHVYHQAIFRCQRCGKERTLKSQTLPTYVDRKMFGHQSIVTSQLIAQGLCATCAKKK